MTIRMLSGLVLGMLMAAAAQAECNYPKEPGSLPDGNTATQEQMVEGMKAVKDYQNKMGLLPADGYGGLKVLARLRQGP